MSLEGKIKDDSLRFRAKKRFSRKVKGYLLVFPKENRKLFNSIHEYKVKLKAVNQQLENEITKCKRAEEEVIRHKAELEAMITKRTVQLEAKNEALKGEIAERKQAEEEARRREREFRAIFELSSVGMAQRDSSTGVLIRVNQRLCEMTGYSAKELLNQKDIMLTHPDDRERDRQVQSPVFKGDLDTWSIEKRYVRKNGEVIWVLVNGRMVRDSTGQPFRTIAVIQDITERKRAEETRRTYRQLLETVVNHLPVAVNVIRGSDLRIQLINPSYQAIAPGKEMVGKTLEELWPETQRSFVDLCRQVLATGEPYQAVDDMNMICRYPGAPIEPAYFSWSLFRVRLPGDEGWAILNTAWETTERKRAEEEIRKLNEQVSKKALDLELANKELDSFTSAVSHDLKNELIVISAFTGKLIKRHLEKLDAKGQEYMRIINSSVENLTALVGDLLELSRLSKAKMKVETLNLSELVLSILKKYQEKDTERQVEVVVPKKVESRGDRRLLTAVLDNLLSNAWKYTKNLAAAHIEFGVIQESREPIFFIRDNGCGFTVPADPEQIFLPFTRFHKVEEYPGTGVGLATVKRIISRHGGKIWVESSVGNGTVFYFTLQKIME
ncbi:MAG: domain S-box [Deltaproteobacteria bacterium]|nr:domain S-box [Deltaproteobacteria bacterium]